MTAIAPRLSLSLALVALALVPAGASAQQVDPLSDYGTGTPEGGTAGVQAVAASRISGPTGCIEGNRASVTIRGRGIRRVEWTVNGRRAKTTTTKDGRTRLTVNLPRTGVYRVSARVVYRSSTRAASVVRRTVVQRCRQAQLPQFTG